MEINQLPDPNTPLYGVVLSEGTPDFTTVISDIDVKQALRLEYTYDDALIDQLIVSAVSHMEASMDTRLAQRSVVVAFPYLNDSMILPLTPVNSVTSITYLDMTYNRSTLDSSVFLLAQTNGQATLARRYNKLFPTILLEENSVLVTCKVGYTDATLVPQALRQALIVMVQDLYKNPDRPLTAVNNVEWLKQPFRKGGFIA